MMGIAQKIKNGTVIYKNYKREMGIKVLLLPLTNFNASQKLRCFRRNLSDIHADTSCISRSDSIVLMISLLKDEDEFSPKMNIFQGEVESVKCKNMIKIVKDVDIECSVYQIGKIVLLLLCLFKIPEVFNLLLFYFKVASLPNRYFL